jgi:hypothetical protein
MLRFILITIIFFAGKSAADVSVDPPYFYGKSSPQSSFIGQVQGNTLEFSSVESICQYLLPDSGNDRAENVVQNASYCEYDLWTFNSYYQDWFLNDEDRQTGFAYPQWTDCLFVQGNSCQSDYPANFSDYTCNPELNTKWGNTLSVCDTPPLCTGESDCYNFLDDLNGCQPKRDNALNDSTTLYNEIWDYTDDDNFSLTCTNSTAESNGTDNPDSTWTDIDNPLAFVPDPPTNGDQGSNGDSSTPTSNPVPISGNPDNSDNTDSQPLDDSFIIAAIDMQTQMVNGQLNSIDASLSSINNSINNNINSINNVSSSVNTQTSMLNSQLNSIGQAVNQTTQVNQEILDLLSIDNSITVTPSSLADSDQQSNIDDFNSSFSNTPIMLAMNNMTNIIVFTEGTCPPLVIDLSDTLIGTTINTDIFCQTLDETSGTLSAVMLACWTFAGFRIFAGA